MTKATFRALVLTVDRTAAPLSTRHRGAGRTKFMTDAQKEQADAMFAAGKKVLDVSFSLGLSESQVRRHKEQKQHAMRAAAAKGESDASQ